VPTTAAALWAPAGMPLALAINQPVAAGLDNVISMRVYLDNPTGAQRADYAGWNRPTASSSPTPTWPAGTPSSSPSAAGGSP
jgi:hypothetical protein